jgi:hypothetical protein
LLLLFSSSWLFNLFIDSKEKLKEATAKRAAEKKARTERVAAEAKVKKELEEAEAAEHKRLMNSIEKGAEASRKLADTVGSALVGLTAALASRNGCPWRNFVPSVGIAFETSFYVLKKNSLFVTITNVTIKATSNSSETLS